MPWKTSLFFWFFTVMVKLPLASVMALLTIRLLASISLTWIPGIPPNSSDTVPLIRLICALNGMAKNATAQSIKIFMYLFMAIGF